MPRTGWTPSILPNGEDQTVYLVVDRFGALGVAYRETDVVRTDLETTITDLMSGQFSDPVRVVAFNTAERWAQDVSKDIALEIQIRSDIDGHRQLVMRLAKPQPRCWRRPLETAWRRP